MQLTKLDRLMASKTLIVTLILFIIFPHTILVADDRTSYEGPVIDMHMHAYSGSLNISNPNTGDLLAKNGKQHRTMSLMIMGKYNVVLGAVSVNEQPELAFQVLKAWEKGMGGKLLKGLFIGKEAGYPPINSVRKWITSGDIDFLGEAGFQYDGRSPSDADLFKYYKLAQEFDIPIGIHTGTGAPNNPYFCCPKFRLSLGNPYLLEDVLIKFPKLRIWAMHAGGQYFNEMVTMMTMYPQLYVDISPYTWLNAGNAELLDRFLIRAKEQRALDRVMFGSDQMRWPEAIESAINRVKSIKYLNGQEKADILYNNAARFLQLSESEIRKHHGN
jgi:hypothetical protein